MPFCKKYSLLIIYFISIFIIVIYLVGCKRCEKRTYVSTYINGDIEISSVKFWILQAFSTNNDDVQVVVIERDIGDGEMFMRLRSDDNGNLTYNSPTIVNGRLEKKGLYIVKENQLIYLTKHKWP